MKGWGREGSQWERNGVSGEVKRTEWRNRSKRDRGRCEKTTEMKEKGGQGCQSELQPRKTQVKLLEGTSVSLPPCSWRVTVCLWSRVPFCLHVADMYFVGGAVCHFTGLVYERRLSLSVVYGACRSFSQTLLTIWRHATSHCVFLQPTTERISNVCWTGLWSDGTVEGEVKKTKKKTLQICYFCLLHMSAVLSKRKEFLTVL